MKIQNLRISNFRGIADVSIESLGSMVIIAGQNGSGKSCIFDAIRLLKSVYGGYQANEWQQWLGEFQINLTNNASDFLLIFNDPQRDVEIRCDFKISADEKQFISNNAVDLLREKIWKTILPEAYTWGRTGAMFAAQMRDREPEVAGRIAEEHRILLEELANPTVGAEFRIKSGMPPEIRNSIALSIIFSTFRPRQIGVLDFHGAQRHYGRESVQGINLSLDANDQQRSQTALYNYGAKYNNVKSEMAASYVREILAEQAGIERSSQSTLTSTLQELFQTFFPDKEFLGPIPSKSGSLAFPVKIAGGGEHDLDELSAGEKEILYGYLRIRNSAPRYSIILLDEPELHLNPRLIRGLPEFYKKNLGEALDNQIWLVTHSDALLREVVGRDGYNVYHMLPCGAVGQSGNQLKPLSARQDLDLALVGMVGDLAAYRPGAKVVILEGGGDSDFDKRVVSTLFPGVCEKINLISGTNKQRVKALLGILDKAANEGIIPFEFFCITDRDSEAPEAAHANHYSWDVYHIENYFLVPEFVLRVVKDVDPQSHLTAVDISELLQQCAKDILPTLLRRELSLHLNSQLVGEIDTNFNSASENLAIAAADAAARSISRINSLQPKVSAETLGVFLAEREGNYLRGLSDGTWMSVFPGRDVLKRLVSRLNLSISYEIFRNLVLAAMGHEGYKPQGMADTLNRIAGSGS